MSLRGGKVVSSSIVLMLALVPVADAARRSEKRTRTESHEYSGPAGLEGQGSQASACINGSGCLVLHPLKGEQYLSLHVTDTVGSATPFHIGFHGANTVYCGDSDVLWLNGAREVSVMILAASAACSGVGTTGSLIATFSNQR